MQTQLQTRGTIEIKLVKQLPTPKQFLKHQIAHYTAMLLHPKLECRSLARKTLFNLKKTNNASY